MGRARRAIAAKIGLDRETVMRGTFAVRALRRIVKPTDGGSQLDALKKEQRRLLAHQRAAAKRLAVDRLMDHMAVIHGVVLGWYLGPSENHCQICLAATGKNFFIGRRPVIGFPGAVHGHTCVCTAGAPFPNAVMLPTR